ncbi:MAG: hypothetical protein ACI4GD_09255 [Lachnospiraceae bacterium]
MNYLEYIEHTTQCLKRPIQVLMSGQSLSYERFLRESIGRAYQNGENILVIDNTKEKKNISEMFNGVNYKVINGLAGKDVYNPFDISSIENMARFRELLATFQISEKEKQKMVSYLSFVRHLQMIEGKDGEITMEILASEYYSYEAVAKKLNTFLEDAKITDDELYFLLGKYSELSAAAADLENFFPLLIPFVNTYNLGIEKKERGNYAIILQTGKMGRDQTLSQMLLQLFKFGMEEKNDISMVLYMDNGFGNREELHYLTTELSSQISLNVFSKDIFTTPTQILTEILNRSDVKIYGRHNMSSAMLLEKELGDIEVVKYAYNETYDRRWKANSPYDILFGRNKTESYQTLAPQKQPLYKKELLSMLMPHQVVIDVMGHKVMTTI